MTLIDIAIVVIPMVFLGWLAISSRKYVRGVADYLVAGRVAGRYVLAVADMTAGLSVITLVAGAEQYYQTGFAVAFWGVITAPIGIFIALSGFVLYRWRQTRCMSMGQFIELRYGSRFFRVFCAVLKSLAEIMTNAIGPAIATNFFIYYMGLPHRIMICGVNLPCYAIIVVLCLSLAMLFLLPGGRISLLITDCIQGIISYPIFVMIVGYLLLYFSWWDEVVPVMWDRVPGQSFMNPYDISQLRDFNIFALVVTIMGSIVNRGGWIGNDSTGSGRTPHEQKMSNVLGSWRTGFSTLTIFLLAIVTIVFMNHPKFDSKDNKFGVSNNEIRRSLSIKIIDSVVEDPAMKEKVTASIKAIPPVETDGKLLSQSDNYDTRYFDVIKADLGDTPEGRYLFQKYRSLYNQMLCPSVLQKIFPVGMVGLFCLMMVMMLVSTDDSRIFNSATTLMQDIILPMFKGHLPPEKHLRYLKLTAIGVAVLFLVSSLFFSQLDYINMFTTIMCALWLGGAGPIIIFGLYTRFGNLTGAWCAIIFGSGTSLLGLVLQRTWAMNVYPFIERMGMVDSLDSLLRTLSSPFNPWIVWQMDPVKFPINSFEIYFISMILALSGYVIGSYLTYKPFDLDKLLHRGAYAEGEAPAPERWTVKNVFRKILGITPEYTRGDRIIAYSVFFYAIVYRVGIAFLAIIIFNAVWKWPNNWWGVKFYITHLIIPGIVGVISTVWFMNGGIRDSIRLFRDLKARTKTEENDNGQVL